MHLYKYKYKSLIWRWLPCHLAYQININSLTSSLFYKMRDKSFEIFHEALWETSKLLWDQRKIHLEFDLGKLSMLRILNIWGNRITNYYEIIIFTLTEVKIEDFKSKREDCIVRHKSLLSRFITEKVKRKINFHHLLSRADK